MIGTRKIQADQWGKPRQPVVSIVKRVQTYRVWAKLACGHEMSYTYNADSHTFKHPKTISCWNCPRVAEPVGALRKRLTDNEEGRT